MKKNIEFLMAKQFAELAVCNLDAVMKDDSLSDKEYNNIREAHDSIASARDTIERLTKPQRMVSAEAKENGYSEPEELTEFEQRIMRLVNRSTFQRRTVDEDGARYVAGLLLPYAKKQLEKQSEQKHALDIEIPFGAKDSELQEATYLIPEGFHAEIEGNEVHIKKGKQKPAWSKEDEEIIHNIRMLIEKYAISQSAVDVNGELCDKICMDADNWLKSLKERYTWKPSEELDEASYRVGIKRVLDNPESYELTKYNWKPSDEQMHMLRRMITALPPGEVHNGLESLYNELKKLKGE